MFLADFSIFSFEALSKMIKEFDITIGDVVSKTGDNTYQCNDSSIQLDNDIAAKLVISH